MELSVKEQKTLEHKNVNLIKIYKKNNRKYFQLKCPCGCVFDCRADYIPNNCLQCSMQDRNLKSKQTCLEKYGVENYSQTAEYQNKKRKTCLEKYGVDSYSKTNAYQQKKTQTCLEKYGVEYPSQSLECKEKIKQTNLEKYGVENYLQSDDSKIKTRQTCLKKYGVDNYAKTEDFKNQIKQTCLKKYGVEYPSQIPDNQSKIKQTCLKKYGVEYHTQSELIKIKIRTSRIDKNLIWTSDSLTQYFIEHPEFCIIKAEIIAPLVGLFTDQEHGVFINHIDNVINKFQVHPIRSKQNNYLPSYIILNKTTNGLYQFSSKFKTLPLIKKSPNLDYCYKKYFFPEKIISELLYKIFTSNNNNITHIENKFQISSNKFREYIEYRFVEYYNHPLHECTEEEYNSLELDHSIPQSFFKKYFPSNWEKLANHYTNVKYLKNLNFENQKKKDKYFFNEQEVLKWYSEGNIIFPEHLYNFKKEGVK